MKEVAYMLFGAAFTLVASYAAGRVLLERLGIDFRRQERAAFAFLLGSALLSWAVFALAAAQAVYKGTFLAVGLAPMALLAFRRRPGIAPAFAALPRVWRWAAAPVILLFSILYVAHAMAPEMSPDGSTYHLGLVYRYYREHGFPAITTNIYANLSQGAEMLFLFAFAWGKHSAAAVVHLSFLFALAWLLLCYGRRFGFPGAAAGAALLVFFSPVAGIDAASAYIDIAVAAVVFALFYLLQIWDAERHHRLLVPIGILAGFAFAMKYTAFLALPYAIGFVLWRLWPGRRWRLRSVATIAVLAAIWIAPWLIKNAIVVGNPVSPFANRVFRNPYVHIAFEDDYREHMRRYDGIASKWDIPLEVTVRGTKLCGLLGPVFLLAPAALLAMRSGHGRRVLFAGLLFGSVYATNIGTRFLLTALPFIALAMSLVFARIPALVVLVVAFHAAASWPDLMKTYCDTYAWRLDRINWRAALRIESQDGFLTRKWPAYTVAKMVDALTPERAVIFTFAQMSEAYCRREVLVSFQSAEAAMLRDIFWHAVFTEYQPTRHLHFNLPPQRTRRLRVIQTAADSPDHFSMHELRFFRNGRELARGASWRLRAWPNTWDVQNAFDASPVTRWKSWESLRPGMFVEVEFGGEVEFDRVVVESSSDSGQSRMQLSIAPDVKPIEIEAAPPLGLRAQVIREMKARGVTHLLVNHDDFAADDLMERQNDWGVTLIGAQAGAKLYKIR